MSVWLRTGRFPSVRNSNGIELKFNPWHDPEDGRFTFAGTGRHYGASDSVIRRSQAVERTGSVRSVSGNRFASATNAIAGRFASRDALRAHAGSDVTQVASPGRSILPDNVTLSTPGANQARPPARPAPVGRGSNIRAFHDPLTLEQAFPGLASGSGGALIAVGDAFLDLHGPADMMTVEVLQNEARRLDREIKAIDPKWRYDEVVPTDRQGRAIRTVQGMTAKVNDLRFQRAAVIARKKGDYEPLQLETVRVVQAQADIAYAGGKALLSAGRLTPRLSDQEALGNYVDQQVRVELRALFRHVGIDSAGSGPVRVNRREVNSTSGDLTYRRPDARVDQVAIDVTLTRKTLATPQIRGFFSADFRPSHVIIIRPRQIGVDHNYAIRRPENK